MMTKGGITTALLGSALLLTAPTRDAQAQVIVDEAGLKACHELKEAFEAFIVSRDGPALQARLFKVRDLAARSTDAYLRNAVSNLPMATSVDELVTWTKVTADICVNRTAKPSTIILGPSPATRSRPAPASEPQAAPVAPAKPITPEAAEAMTKRAVEKTGATKCETKIYGGGAAVTVCE